MGAVSTATAGVLFLASDFLDSVLEADLALGVTFFSDFSLAGDLRGFGDAVSLDLEADFFSTGDLACLALGVLDLAAKSKHKHILERETTVKRHVDICIMIEWL